MAAGGRVGNAVDRGAVNRDKAVDVLVVAEEGFDAAQVAELFFAYRGHEEDVADGAHVVGVHRGDHREQGDQAARVVRDAWGVEASVDLFHLHVGALGEHRVHVRRHDELRPAAAFAQAHHVAFRVDVGVLEAGFLESLAIEIAL